MSCPHCGQPLPEGQSSRTCPHCGGDLDAPGSPVMDEVADHAQRAADSAGRAVQDVLDDPRLRERLPGGSLPLLGSGLVAAAVVAPVLPFIGGGLGLPWSVLMLVGAGMLGAREWVAAGRKLPDALVPVVKWAAHPAFLPMFTALTVTQAFLSLGLGVAPLLWVLAAVVLASVQWRAFKASSLAEPSLTKRPADVRLKRWVFAGVAACAVGLLLPWSSAWSLVPTAHLQRERNITIDNNFAWDIQDNDTWKFNTLVLPSGQGAGTGRGRLGATGVVLGLLALGVLGSVRRAREALPSVVPAVLAGLITVWALTGLSSKPGPWLFLLGILAVDVAVAREWLGPRSAVPPTEPPASA
ncbi:zinc ribbon domain-containing protein [Corallococcus exiguus]|uniref:zinc ribbon domain-containing protein n=1 Tax=Corallococcus exiguus TaxID=83462 RepID=UPI0014717CEB|nr:zinc ribbon domain-containing protein [Corallococcus exiguus]NNB88378.1 zinc ribbon domain-containing protein [Corallococcus exiguus]NNC06603.1 zinc ribbon domain-containing protein [Corallococcus exiguus]